jgi:hypothetical protein
MGPGISAQISSIASVILRPDFAIRDGLVVTPSTSPVAARTLRSAISAVSMKIFIRLSNQLVGQANVTGSPLKHRGHSLKARGQFAIAMLVLQLQKLEFLTIYGMIPADPRQTQVTMASLLPATAGGHRRPEGL